MSLQTWKDEFYPVPATDYGSTRLEAIQHSLRKWTGVLKKNLKKHGVNTCHLILSSKTCSLCIMYHERLACEGCPLNIDGSKCYESSLDSKPRGYKIYYRTGDARPLIRELKAALKKEENK
jgi:hypothetical protein